MRVKYAFALLLMWVAAPAAGQAVSQAAPALSSRPEQIAALIEKIIPLATSRDWDEARAAFPDARWQAPNEYTDALRGNRMRELQGEMAIAGLQYRISITGTLDSLWDVTLEAPENVRPRLNWTAIGDALAARQVEAELVVCADGPRGDGYRILSHAGRTAWLNFYTSQQHGGENYHFGFFNPYNPASDEAGLRQMMEGRCGRRR